MILARVDRSPRALCAVYTRQSVKTESDLNSCDAQREVCVAFAIANGFQVIKDGFDVVGESVGTLDRPALQRWLKLVRSGTVRAWVVQRLDRLSLRVAHCASLLDEFRKLDIQVLAAETPELQSGAAGPLLTDLRW